MNIKQAFRWLQLEDNAIGEFLNTFREETIKVERCTRIDAVVDESWRNMMAKGGGEKARIKWLAFKRRKLAELGYPNTMMDIEQRDIYLGLKLVQTFLYKEDNTVCKGVDFVNDNIQADIDGVFGPHGRLRDVYVGIQNGIDGEKTNFSSDTIQVNFNGKYSRGNIVNKVRPSQRHTDYESLDEAVSFEASSMVKELWDEYYLESEGGSFMGVETPHIYTKGIIEDDNYLPSRSEVVEILRNVKNAPTSVTLESLDYPDGIFAYSKAWRGDIS